MILWNELTDEDLVKFRNENVCNGMFNVARIALGEACIPFVYQHYHGYRYPIQGEIVQARMEIANTLNYRRP